MPTEAAPSASAAYPAAAQARLVVVAHGTRHRAGNEVAAAIARLAGERLGLVAEVAYVELCAPLLVDVLGAADGAAHQGPGTTIVVPLLLSTGYHVRVDLPEAAAAAPGEVRVTAPLGPDRLLAAAQVDRLRAAGAQPGGPVVLVAAGSRDPAALPELERASRLLAEAWGGPVRLATLGGLGPRPEQVVRPGDAVSPYLLAEGFFATRCAELARAAGAGAIADVIGSHERVIDLVAQRYRTAL